MRTRVVAIVIGLMALFGGSVSTATPSGADALSNPYHTSIGYNNGLASCRWFYDATYDKTYTGILHSYVTQQLDYATGEASQANGLDHNWLGFYNLAQQIDNGWDTNTNVQSQINTMSNDCAALTKIDGSSSDYVHEPARWNPCVNITVSSSGPDISATIGEIAQITGIRVQQVPNGAAAFIHVDFNSSYKYPGLSGQTFYSYSTFLDSAQIYITPFAPANITAKVIKHELGHAFGIDHVAATNELMGANGVVSSTTNTDYNEGDYIGMWSQGVAAGPGGCG